MNCTSLRYNCSSTSSDWFLSIASRTPVSEHVSEGAYEFDAPLVKDVPFMQALSLNGAVRQTFYSVSGDYTTWKLGLDWHVNDDFTLRGTASRDIRAPTLADLYAPTTATTVTNTDLLTGLSKAVPAYSSGNPHLTAEIGHTFTGGFVWQPHFVPGFSLSLDGYHIKITNAISSELGYNSLIQQACYASAGNSQYCALQSRPLGYTNTSAANAVSAWYDEEFNISWIETYGGDLEANYNTTIVDRPLTLRTFVNWQPHLLFVTPGLSTLDHAGVAYSTGSLYPAPRVAATLLAHMGVTHDTSVDLMERWRSPYTLQDQPGQGLDRLFRAVFLHNRRDSYLFGGAGEDRRSGRVLQRPEPVQPHSATGGQLRLADHRRPIWWLCDRRRSGGPLLHPRGALPVLTQDAVTLPMHRSRSYLFEGTQT